MSEAFAALSSFLLLGYVSYFSIERGLCRRFWVNLLAPDLLFRFLPRVFQSRLCAVPPFDFVNLFRRFDTPTLFLTIHSLLFDGIALALVGIERGWSQSIFTQSASIYEQGFFLRQPIIFVFVFLLATPPVKNNSSVERTFSTTATSPVQTLSPKGLNHEHFSPPSYFSFFSLFKLSSPAPL